MVWAIVAIGLISLALGVGLYVAMKAIVNLRERIAGLRIPDDVPASVRGTTRLLPHVPNATLTEILQGIDEQTRKNAKKLEPSGPWSASAGERISALESDLREFDGRIDELERDVAALEQPLEEGA